MNKNKIKKQRYIKRIKDFKRTRRLLDMYEVEAVDFRKQYSRKWKGFSKSFL